MKKHVRFLLLLVGLAIIAWLLALVFARIAPDDLTETVYRDDGGVTTVETRSPSDAPETMIVEPHFVVSTEDCSATESIAREVSATDGVARATLTALLDGLNADEQGAGYSTAINADAELQSLRITDGIAYVDFSSDLDASGSCMVTAIRAQIENSLLTLPTITDVVISIDGETAEILQP